VKSSPNFGRDVSWPVPPPVLGNTVALLKNVHRRSVKNHVVINNNRLIIQLNIVCHNPQPEF